MAYRPSLNITRWIHLRWQRRAAWAVWALVVALPLALSGAMALRAASGRMTNDIRSRIESTLNLPVEIGQARLAPWRNAAVLYDTVVYYPRAFDIDGPRRVLIEAERIDMIGAGNGRTRFEALRPVATVAMEDFARGEAAAMTLFERLWTLRPEVVETVFEGGRVVLSGGGRASMYDGIDGQIGFHAEGGLVIDARSDNGLIVEGAVHRLAGAYRASLRASSPELPLPEAVAAYHPALAEAFPSPLAGSATVTLGPALAVAVQGEAPVQANKLPGAGWLGAPEQPLMLDIERLDYTATGGVYVEGVLRHHPGIPRYTAGRLFVENLDALLLGGGGAVSTGEGIEAGGELDFSRFGIAFRYADPWLSVKGALGGDFAALTREAGGVEEASLRVPPTQINVHLLKLRVVSQQIRGWFDMPRLRGDGAD